MPRTSIVLEAIRPVANELMELIQELTANLFNEEVASVEVVVELPPAIALNSCDLTFRLACLDIDTSRLREWTEKVCKAWIEFCQEFFTDEVKFGLVGFSTYSYAEGAWSDTDQT